MSRFENPPPVLTKYKTFGPYAHSTAGLIQVAHGLGKKPTLVSGFIKCLTAERNWAVGDEVEISMVDSSTGSSTNVNGHWSDAANVYFRWGSAGYYFLNVDKTTGAAVFLTPANWEFYLKVFA